MDDSALSKTGKSRGFRLNRYAAVAMVVIAALLAILLKTTVLQFRGLDWDPVNLTRGQGGKMTVKAPRGDIVDSSGRVLAYSSSRDDLYLAYAGLDSQELNRRILDLVKLLGDYGLEPVSKLTDYLDLSSESKSQDPESKEALSFVFKKDLSEIAKWQQNKDLFNLSPATASVPESAKVKLNPQDFYHYLLYSAFAIEDPEAGGNLYYSPWEAWQIMKVRYQIFENNWTFKQGEPVLLAQDIPASLQDILQEQKLSYPGVLLKREFGRQYTDDSRYFSHILGYVGKISAPEYDQLKGQGYSINDYTGKAGVEYTAEPYLQGKTGSLAYGTWFKDQDDFVYREGEGTVDPEPGSTVYLCQDLNVQKTLYASLYDTILSVREKKLGKGDSAAAVMLNVKNGQILAMGSIPSFQPSDFMAPPEDKEAYERAIRDLQDTEHKPIQNRCISEIYAPASTFKPITGQTGILTGVIDRNHNSYECKGKETIGYKNWVCYGEPIHGHGMITLSEGLGYSCNLYFFKLGLDIGIDALSAHCKELGLGEYSNIDLPGEAKGIRPSPELKAQTRMTPGDQEWYPADTCQTAIGQFDHAYTMVQLVRAIAGAVSNELVTPHVIKDIQGPQGQVIRPEQISKQNLGMPQEAVDLIKEGMGELKYYTAFNVTNHNFLDYPINVGAKTGTAEVGLELADINAVFVCFAPLEDPEVAIACIVENGGKGDVSSNIARDLLDAYYGFEPRPELLARLAEMDADPEAFLLMHEREEWHKAQDEDEQDGQETVQTGEDQDFQAEAPENQDGEDIPNNP